MSNGFSIAPGNIPGNLTVGGQLTVNGGLLKVLTDTYAMRMGKLTNGTKGVSWNKSSELGGLDDPALFGLYEGFDPNTGRLGGELTTPGNVDGTWHRGAVMFASNVHQNQQGVTEGTLVSFPMRDRQFFSGLSSNVVIVMWGTLSANAADTITLRFRSPSGVVLSQAVTGATNQPFMWRIVMGGPNPGTQVLCVGTFMANALPVGVQWNGADESTLNNVTVSLTAQGTNAADVVDVLGVSVQELNTH